MVPAKVIFKKIGSTEALRAGLLVVPLDKIVSSAGRYRDFDLTCLPRRKEMEDRWVNIARSSYSGVNPQPVNLYGVRKIYIVEDGNHRVSVAHAAGQETIKAMVIEIDASMLIPDPSCTRLGFKI